MEINTKNALIASITAIIVALIGFVGVWIFGPKSPPLVMAGKIQSPKEGTTVESKFSAKGTLENIPDETFVWLAIKIGDDIWPKKEIQNKDQTFIETIEEYGDTDTFNLVLIALNLETNKKINEWHTKRIQESNWDPFKGLFDIAILDGIQLKLRKQTN